ncbi:glutathione S-transferase family protein [Terrarubrum flagellatum]|uniref:glutathione S-transferase family protein n=1 Tax=Terrirubrum flagellatum TaxID=2895980 RepID=UPI003144D9FD
MSLTLYYHPLSSFCQKAVIAFYEADVPFTPYLLDSAEAYAEVKRLWPIGKFPIMRDEARDLIVPESTLIIEYIAARFPAAARLAPESPDKARDVRLGDRFYDLYVNMEMQKIVGDRRRPADAKDPHGVAESRAKLKTCYDMIELGMRSQRWAAGEEFTMADCAAAPALFYANLCEPFGDAHPATAAYYERLKARPSVARTFEEAKPYFHLFPQ